MDTLLNEIAVTKTTHSRISTVDFDHLSFGKSFADHMFEMNYEHGKWQSPTIVPFQPLELHPATSALHYGQAIFEGLKATKNESGEILLFRPLMNIRRFNRSAKRMCMAEVPENLFFEGLKTLLDLDRAWTPSGEGQSLYIRPFMIATDNYIGIRPSEQYKFLIITCPVENYYAEPVKVKIETYYTRAAEGGVGRAKAAGNYAASLYPAQLAAKEGYRQLIWTDAKTHTYIEESGTMNVMFVIDGVLITPEETKDTILKGITKRSVVDIATHWGMKVEERPVSVKEVIGAIERGTLQDAFGVGTAATIAPISHIGYEGTNYTLPDIEQRSFSNKAKNYIDDYRRGRVADEFGWIVNI